jgi:hypothetical protein
MKLANGNRLKYLFFLNCIKFRESTERYIAINIVFDVSGIINKKVDKY